MILSTLVLTALAGPQDNGTIIQPGPWSELDTIRFSSMQMCDQGGLHAVAPLPAEVGHYNATRVDFKLRPFVVEKVNYLMFDGTWHWTSTSLPCNPSQAHDLVLFTGPTVTDQRSRRTAPS